MWYLYIIYEALIHYQILTGAQLRPRVERDGITLWLWGRPFIDDDSANAKHMLLGVVDRFGIYALYTLIYALYTMIYALYTLISSQWISLAYSITLTSKLPRWRLKSPASRLFTQSFIQTQMKENIKAPRHWPLCGEFTGTGEFPAQMASNAESVSIWWRHHVFGSHQTDVIKGNYWPSMRRTHISIDWPHYSTGIGNVSRIFAVTHYSDATSGLMHLKSSENVLLIETFAQANNE